jgi:hypothetical protein
MVCISVGALKVRTVERARGEVSFGTTKKLCILCINSGACSISPIASSVIGEQQNQ